MKRLAVALALLVSASPALAECIDLNTASLEELRRIEHVGEAFAEAIVDGRPWGHVRELRQISGIGARRPTAHDRSARGAERDALTQSPIHDPIS